MAEYVVPNTTIYIIKDCPCEPDYKNTMYFGNKADQFTTFSKWIKYTLNAQSYQRYGAGRIQVELPVENLYDCNYLIFQNTNFKDSAGNVKKFYAFITDVEYVNNNTSTITYEIDVIQTWLGDYEIRDVFVEREHPLTDKIGENLVPEPVSFDEYTISYYDEISYTFSGATVPTKLSSLWMMAWWADGTSPHVVSGLPTMLWAYAQPFTEQGLNTFRSYLSGAGVDANSIVAFGLVPELFAQIGAVVPDTLSTVKNYRLQFLRHYNEAFESATAGVRKSYTPQCKKLYTSPYWGLWVSNNTGNTKVYPMELFTPGVSSNDLYFQLIGDYSPNPTVMLVPENFKTVQGRNFAESMTLSGYPQCGTTSDTYKAWLAQQGGANAVQFIGGALMTLLSAVSQNYVGAVAGATQAVGALARRYDASTMADSGTPGGNNNLLAAAHLMTFHYGIRHLTAEAAERVDMYFRKYGYATNTVKKPNIGTRPFYNYVKTNGCSIDGSIPASAEKRICEVYDRGITFWKTTDHFGDYSVDNSPGATNPEHSEVVS